MGIPRLIATLEPHARHEVLQNDRVVIDGPALAYHIFHICRLNNVNQPSYGLLGRAVNAWLDQLTEQDVAIQSIYFDGHLPLEKRPVRMSRCYKLTLQMSAFFSTHPNLCPRHHFTKDTINSELDLFASAHRGDSSPKAQLPPPSFLVPAVIDALRHTPRYAPLVRIVPGEADAYCARHVAQQRRSNGAGGLVLTSDSDLLAHDLGDGRVAFLRDVHQRSDGALGCATFAPAHICRNLGLEPEDACRLAYERAQSTNASLPELVKSCKKPIVDQKGFKEFCQQYLHHEQAQIPTAPNRLPVDISHLDPRVSELILQLDDADAQEDHIKLFLPNLIESPARGSAWEGSTSVRQLAYTVARWLIPGSRSSVQEYRRVQEHGQKGREVMVLTKNEADDTIKALLNMLSCLEGSSTKTSWLMLSLAIDIGEYQKQGKTSHSLSMFLDTRGPRRSHNPTDKVPWDLIHLTAQLQAGLYSLRILHQVLTLAREPVYADFSPKLLKLRSKLSTLPRLGQYPDVDTTAELLRDATDLGIISALEPFVHVPKRQSTDDRVEDGIPKRKRRKKTGSSGAENAQSSGTKRIANNSFGLLSVDQ